MTGSLRERKKRSTRVGIARAAGRLFAARGFEGVTLVEVAEAAQVSPRTLFRYFADKEELLFGEDEAVAELLLVTVEGRPEEEPVLDSAVATSVALAAVWQDRHGEGRARQAVIDASPALTARNRAKQQRLEELLTEALSRRGVDHPRARLVSRVAVACFDEAVHRWFDDDDPVRPGLAARVRETHAELASRWCVLAERRTAAPS